MKFSLKEAAAKSSILKEEFNDEIKQNALDLIQKINALNCPFPRFVSSFIRSKTRQIEIYKQKARDKKHPFENGVFDLSKVPLKSQHLTGRAIDIQDGDGKLKKWIQENVSKLEEVGLYVEDFRYTKNWVHLQSTAPKSGSRFFIP